jgi:hypothetical protein
LYGVYETRSRSNRAKFGVRRDLIQAPDVTEHRNARAPSLLEQVYGPLFQAGSMVRGFGLDTGTRGWRFPCSDQASPTCC